MSYVIDLFLLSLVSTFFMFYLFLHRYLCFVTYAPPKQELYWKKYKLTTLPTVFSFLTAVEDLIISEPDYPNPAKLFAGEHVFKFTATDKDENTAACSFIVTVKR